jgi:hypothetical protein
MFNQPPAVLRSYVEGDDAVHGGPFMRRVFDLLTRPLVDEDLRGAGWDRSTPRLLEPDTEENLQQLFRENHWTDYLPIVLRTEQRVEAMLAGTSRALDEGELVLIYPEGTVTKDPDFLPMQAKTGTVRLSLMSGVPITPLASWGSQAVWQKSGRGSLKFGRPIWVKAGAPIDLSDRADELDDRDALHEMTDRLTAALTALVLDLRGRYPKRWSDDG